MNATGVVHRSQKGTVSVVVAAAVIAAAAVAMEEITGTAAAASEVEEEVDLEEEIVEAEDTKWVEGETTEMIDVAGHTEDLFRCHSRPLLRGGGTGVWGEVRVCIPLLHECPAYTV